MMWLLISAISLAAITGSAYLVTKLAPIPGFSLLNPIFFKKSFIVSSFKTISQIYHPPPASCTILKSGKCAKITYERYGTSYSTYVPYRRDLVSKMSGTQVWYQKDSERIEITQQPGIPYMFNFEMLDADFIIVKKNGVEKIFTSDKMLNFYI